MAVEPIATQREPAAPRSWRDWLSDHIGLDGAQKLEVYRSVARSTTLRDATYWAEIIFAAGIATLGLTLNSPAVIIGAMLISPLMGPILAAGLALAAGDFVLAIRATANIVVSCTAAVVLSSLLVTLLPFRDMTPEIAARTHPNTLDLVIALFSGAVGALAVSKNIRGVATSVPGVAIAVALMPPLCVTGYGFGLLLTLDREVGLDVLRGGLLLFVTNLIAITFASMLVFAALNIDALEVRRRIREGRTGDDDTVRPWFRRSELPKELQRIGSLPARILMVGCLVALVFVPLKRSFDALETEIRARQQLNTIQKQSTQIWDEMFTRTKTGERRSYIDSIEAHDQNGTLRLTVRAFTSLALSNDERAAYVRRVAEALGRDSGHISLALVEIPTSRYEVASRSKDEAAPPPPPAPAAVQLQTAGAAALAAVGGSALPSGATLLDSDVTVRDGGAMSVDVIYLAAVELSSDARDLITRDLRSRLGSDAISVMFQWIPGSVDLHLRAGKPDDASDAVIALIGRTLSRDAALVARLSSRAGRSPAEASASIRLRLMADGVRDSQVEMAEDAGVPANVVRVQLTER